ncbi:MAG: hypothetical protein GX542_02395, partial [Rhodococcus sp.]|nr:hypothetical protein [Rhodococcus sp. (in: high G+C Gram-positive bacteria)]
LSLALGCLTGGTWWQRGLVAGFVHWVANVSLFFFADPAAALEGEATAGLPFVVPQLALGLVMWLWYRRRITA